jgi:hypothetical protein
MSSTCCYGYLRDERAWRVLALEAYEGTVRESTDVTKFVPN